MAARIVDDAGRGMVLSRNTVSRETLDRLDAYVALLRIWQARINLVAPSTLNELWPRHIEEGLVLWPRIPTAADKLVDLGSGAGLPGLVLAILLAERGAGSIALVESNGKKAAFLRTVIRELDLPAEVHAKRIEACGGLLAAANIVTARALAPLDLLFGMVAPHIGPTTICLFPKGRTHQGEIEAASAHWRFDMVKHFSLNEPDSVILEIRNLQAGGR